MDARYRWCRCAQPPANGCEAYRLRFIRAFVIAVFPDEKCFTALPFRALFVVVIRIPRADRPWLMTLAPAGAEKRLELGRASNSLLGI